MAAEIPEADGAVIDVPKALVDVLEDNGVLGEHMALGAVINLQIQTWNKEKKFVKMNFFFFFFVW